MGENVEGFNPLMNIERLYFNEVHVIYKFQSFAKFDKRFFTINKTIKNKVKLIGIKNIKKNN